MKKLGIFHFFKIIGLILWMFLDTEDVQPFAEENEDILEGDVLCEADKEQERFAMEKGMVQLVDDDTNGDAVEEESAHEVCFGIKNWTEIEDDLRSIFVRIDLYKS